MTGSGVVNYGTKDKPVWLQEGASSTDIANAKNKAREDEARSIYDKIIGTYAPGGEFGKGTEAMLERQKTKDTASATQQLISSGLYGSTMTAGLPKKWEEEVGMPSRLKLEDLRYGAWTSALGQKAQFITGIEDQSPSYELMAGLSQAAGYGSQTPSMGSWAMQGLPAYGSTTGSTRTSTPSSTTQAGITGTAPKAAAPSITYDEAYLYGGPVSSEYVKLQNQQAAKKANEALLKRFTDPLESLWAEYGL
jgi:hypothetical protein